MPSVKSTWWCFTLNYEGKIPNLEFKEEEVQYACWQAEKVSHTHLQGVIQFRNKNTTLIRAKGCFNSLQPHLEKMRGKPDEAIRYCKKDESRIDGPWEFGEYLKKGSNKRKARERYDEDPEEMELVDPKLARKVRAKISNEDYLLKEFPSFDRPWQIELQRKLEEDADDRHVIWVYGADGNEGKSTFARYLLQKGWFYTRGGQIQNVTYQYIGDPTRNAVFDYPRSSKDFINYSTIEMIKDRIIQSDKYEPITMTMRNDVHVVIMSNQLPDYEKISEDRIVLIDCNM